MSEGPKPPAVDPATVPARGGSSYPEQFKREVEKRSKQALGNALSLTQFGVNLVTLEPGAWSAHRHWHANEDEFVYVVEGELVLVTDAGEQALGPGMAAGFPAGVADGHHLVNRGDRAARYLEVGTRAANDEVAYPDVDLHLMTRASVPQFTNKNGDPY